jgi:succinate dehydrogenase flavin-adding protein (antitoxin of CptAB toxin-antitoxin module)
MRIALEIITLESQLTAGERQLLASLTTPRAIQDFLDTVAYEPEYFNRSPLRVLRERQGHCLDGALFAAAALRRLGHRPQVLDLTPEPLMDDDHVLAVFEQAGAFGAVAKSNFAGLRFREPVFRTLRELVMSYFEDYFNTLGRKTLRGYTRLLDLSKYDAANWETSDVACDRIEKRLQGMRSIPILTPDMIRTLSPVDERRMAAGLIGADETGLFKPGIA